MEETKGRILGIGGVFFKSDHPTDLNMWYEHHLGLLRNEYHTVVFPWRAADEDRKHLTTFSIFPRASKYYEGGFMINFIVDDLDALLTRLESEGVRIDPKREADPTIGRFAWIYDADGNRIELWQPAVKP